MATTATSASNARMDFFLAAMLAQAHEFIIELEKGMIVEQGSHEYLLKKNGAYAELWNHQYGNFLGGF